MKMRSDEMRRLGLFGGFQFHAQSTANAQFEFRVDGHPPADTVALYLDFLARHSPGVSVSVTRVAQVVFRLEREPIKRSRYVIAARAELPKAARRLLKKFGRHLLRFGSHVRASVSELDARAVLEPRYWVRRIRDARSLVHDLRRVNPEDIRDPALRDQGFFEPLQVIHDELINALESDDRLWLRRMVGRRRHFIAS